MSSTGSKSPGGAVVDAEKLLPALTCRGVYAAHGRIEVCHGVDLEVDSGTVTALLGPNGAGKSSFLGALAGQVRGRGQISVASTPLRQGSAHGRARAGLALVPEGRGNCFGSLTVEENLMIGAQLAQGDRSSSLAWVFELFPVLESRLAQDAGTLSGGEQQMLAIGMALVRRPALLMLDEPSQGLAPRILEDLRTIFLRLREKGVGMLVAEQNFEFASQIADRYVVMVGGRFIAAGERSEMNRDAMAAAFLSADGLRA